MTSAKILLAAIVSLAVPAAAQAATVDFETEGAGAPAFLQPLSGTQTITSNGATFTGGRIVTTTSDFVPDDAAADFTAAYTTMPYTGFKNPLTIGFLDPMSSVSFDLVNNIAGNYTVTTNTGFSQTYTLGDFANQTIALSGTGITNVAIQYAVNPQQPTPYFDFAVDNVSFSAAAAVPEPGTWAMVIAGFGLIGGVLRRRRTSPLAFA